MIMIINVMIAFINMFMVMIIIMIKFVIVNTGNEYIHA